MCTHTIASFLHTLPPAAEEYGTPPSPIPTDPMLELIASRQVVPMTSGSFGYSGRFLEHLNLLDSIIHKMAIQFGAVEESYPVLVDLNEMLNNGYLHSFPQHAFFVSSVSEESGCIDEVASEARNADMPRLAETLKRRNTLRAGLAPTVCYNCFHSRRGTHLDGEPSIVTARNTVHRYESRNTVGLERLQSFQMREVIFFGTPDNVQQQRSKLQQESISLAQHLNLHFRVLETTDPFFALDAANKRTFQAAMKLKYEMQCFIPQTKKWLAVASFNLHRDHLIKAYMITGSSQTLHSGCIGFGLERLLYAIYCQQGLTANFIEDNNA